MRNKASGAILDALGGVGAITAAAVPEGIERTIAEKAVKVPAVHSRMTGKIFTIAVLKKFIAHMKLPRIPASVEWGHVP